MLLGLFCRLFLAAEIQVAQMMAAESHCSTKLFGVLSFVLASFYAINYSSSTLLSVFMFV